MFITGIVCAIVSGGFCLVLGAILGKAEGDKIRSEDAIKHSEQIFKISGSMANLITGSASNAQAFKDVIVNQEKAYRKEIKDLKLQLEEATEEIAEMSDVMMNETDEDEEPSQIKVVARKQATAIDKLVTLRKILEDSASKKEQVDPNSLLGIVNFTKD